MKHTRAAAAAAAASAVLLAIGAPASAAPPLIEHWTDHVEHIEQEVAEDWCPEVGYPVLHIADASGTSREIERRGELYWASTLRVEESWTNVENGRTFSFVFHGQDKDMEVTTNEDGTTQLRVLFVGVTQYYDSDGNRLFKNVGRTFLDVLVDAQGEWIEESIVEDAKGRFDTADRNFCADILEFTG